MPSPAAVLPAEAASLPAAQRAWFANAVQMAVLMRTMPTVRHDLAAPLSVMRMGCAVLKRRLAQDVLERESLLERVGQLDEHLASLGQGLRRLRHWDLRVSEREALPAIAAEAVELVRPLLMMRGVAVELAEGGAPTPDDVQADHHAALYLMLAAIYVLAEAPGAAPARIVLRVDGRSAVVEASGRADDAEAGPPLPDAQLPIDAGALSCLAAHLGAVAGIAPQAITVQMPA